MYYSVKYWSISSLKAELFKLWLARVGWEHIEEAIDPELTDEWDARGVQKGVEYAILTDEITRAWSGMSTRQYKNLKGLKKENLRDNMTTRELVLNMLAEATTEISKQRAPETLVENMRVAHEGGEAAGEARKAVEARTGVPVITSQNAAQLNRELFAAANENGGKLKNCMVLFCDELGTMPPFDILPLFSAGRSRRLTLVPIIQSLAQLEKNYGRGGCKIIQDNCQDTIFGGFAPNSQTAETLSKALGSRTVLSGSVSRGKNDPSQSLQMMERALLTPDELKPIPKGSFIVMKIGTHPMCTRLQLFLNWGITFEEPFFVPERANRTVAYANRVDLERNLSQSSKAEEVDECRAYPVSGHGDIAHTPAQEKSRKKGNQMKTYAEEDL